jgi:tetratricopeptide (TPR) repeat protein
MNKTEAIALGLWCLILGACHRQQARTAPPPPPSTPEVAIPVVVPPSDSLANPARWPVASPPPALGIPPRPIPAVYQTAEEDFDNARYVLAARSYELYLKDYPSKTNDDRILFRLGLCYALADSSAAGFRKARDRFERLIALYPDSPYKPQAKLIMALQDQIEQKAAELQNNEERIRQLTEELNKLKKIDMQRQPSRPPR